MLCHLLRLRKCVPRWGHHRLEGYYSQKPASDLTRKSWEQHSTVNGFDLFADARCRLLAAGVSGELARRPRNMLARNWKSQFCYERPDPQ